MEQNLLADYEFELYENMLLVYPSEGTTRTAGGIILPNKDPREPQQGLVIATGPGQWFGEVFVGVKQVPGSSILYRGLAGEDYVLDGVKLKLIRSTDVLMNLPQKKLKQE